MKKYIGMIVVLVGMLYLTACGGEKQVELLLPSPENITEVEMMENSSNVSNKITSKEEIAKIITEINEHSKSTNKESMNDQPTNVDSYITMTFYHHNAENEQKEGCIYLYQKKGNSYVEQPYAGIWKLEDEVFSWIREDYLEK